MPGTALYIELKAKPGREEDLAAFLVEQRSIVAIEPGNLIWVVVRFDARTFAILDSFDTAQTRESHRHRNVMKALSESDLIAGPPVLRNADVLADWTRS